MLRSKDVPSASHACCVSICNRPRVKPQIIQVAALPYLASLLCKYNWLNPAQCGQLCSWRDLCMADLELPELGPILSHG